MPISASADRNVGRAPQRARLDITPEDLVEMFLIRNGSADRAGPEATRWFRWGYYPTADHYEVLINKCVTAETAWLDVGGGHSVFPYNLPLSKLLSERARLLVGVDPSDNIEHNPYVHEFAKCPLEDYETTHRFDLITLRMVAEHIERPEVVVGKIGQLLREGGLAVIYTPHLWTLFTLVSKTLPFRMHHPIKRYLWNTDAKDTFPAVYRMNTRPRLRSLFHDAGCRERFFAFLPDLSLLMRYPWLNSAELWRWRTLRRFGHQAQDVILAAYEKPAALGSSAR